MNTPATTRPFSPVNMPIDILRINPRLYSGFKWTDVDGNVITYPTYQSAVQAWASQVSPNYKEWIQQPNINQDGAASAVANLSSTPQSQQPIQPSEVDKYIQKEIDNSKNMQSLNQNSSWNIVNK